MSYKLKTILSGKNRRTTFFRQSFEIIFLPKSVKLFFPTKLSCVVTCSCQNRIYPIGPWTNKSFLQLDHLSTRCVHSPSKVIWTGLIHGRPVMQRTKTKPLHGVGVVVHVWFNYHGLYLHIIIIIFSLDYYQ